ncbi:MAG: phosphopyruvate hydratase [PVC group bacterium]|nr:phosphopyruvate hydratase [PVC group bacterium]
MSSGDAKIKSILSREILDSRGNPTIEVDLSLNDGSVHRAAVPSGASTGIYEALELRDKDKNRYMGKGVLIACENVSKYITPALLGKDPREQTSIDKLMVEQLDGSKNEWGWSKSKIGANAILAVSLAVCRAGAHVNRTPLYKWLATLSGHSTSKFVLPVPSLNVINGGSHAGNGLAIQEFMILPTGASNFAEGLRYGAEVYHNLKKVIHEKYGQNACNVGDEGGFAPDVVDTEEALGLLITAIERSGHAGKIQIGMDAAASEFYDEKSGKYDLFYKSKEKKPLITGDELGLLYEKWAKQYNILSIEDPFDQSDFDNYAKFDKRNTKKFQIVGDDLLVTNPVRVQIGIDQGLCNALLLKVNQIGSVTESIEASEMSRKAGWGVMVSHRSGETEDSFIGDLVVGLGTGQIKTGAPCRSERLAKYNQILRIERELGDKGVYAGKDFVHPPTFH